MLPEPPGAFPGCVGALKQDTSAPAKFFGASAGPLFVAPEPLSGTPGSQFVAPGSLSDTPDSLFVAPGSLFVAPGALFVAPGSLSGAPGALLAREARRSVPFREWVAQKWTPARPLHRAGMIKSG